MFLTVIKWGKKFASHQIMVHQILRGACWFQDLATQYPHGPGRNQCAKGAPNDVSLLLQYFCSLFHMTLLFLTSWECYLMYGVWTMLSFRNLIHFEF